MIIADGIYEAFEFDAWNDPTFNDRIPSLEENCPQSNDKLSAECGEAMDDYFENLPLERQDTAWISIPDRLTYGRALTNPVADRNRVVQALQLKECRLEDREVVRWDLSERCHSDAFANLSVFLWACSKYGNDTNLTEESDVDDVASFEFSDPEYYKDMLHWHNVRSLRARWITNKCAEIEVSDFRFDPENDRKHFQMLRSTARRLGEKWDQSSEVPETFVLKSLAARLGDLSTAILYSGPSTGKKDDSWRHIGNNLWQWRRSLMNFDASTQKFSNRRSETIKRLKKGISVAVSLQRSGLEFDWNFLVKRVCTLHDPDEATCQTAIRELSQTFEWDQKDELQTLDKFASLSQKLNLYD
ncbi:MAG: hypothetical protein OXG24_00575 [Gammaproteobacteria bacterium]|nr:hypothetical protein [Gammaproteobacteria bacterium]